MHIFSKKVQILKLQISLKCYNTVQQLRQPFNVLLEESKKK